MHELGKRGSALKQGDQETADQIELKICDMIDKHKDTYQQPVTCFITFERQEASDRCQRYFAENDLVPDKLILFGEELECMRACEPSNVLWENLSIDKYQQRLRMVLALFILFIFLSTAFYTILFM